MIEAYRDAAKTDYPLHWSDGSGTLIDAAIKSALGIGTFFNEGIGDTIRVPLPAALFGDSPGLWNFARVENQNDRTGNHFLSNFADVVKLIF